MVIELFVALLMVVLFIAIARKMTRSDAPRGKLWNLVEGFLYFLRDEVARPAIGKHDADRFVPLLWTMFFFILFCNLAGLLPWLGSPTGAWGTTLALAIVTFATVLYAGIQHFGFVGFWKNQVPHMDLPGFMAPILIPVIWAIEVMGLLIRHAVLSVRLLANMFAGHLVLVSIMGLIAMAAAAGAAAMWSISVVVVLGCAALMLLELFVAFLQAYIFTFLSALFIGAAVHKH
jgi:F-type H+-transporting ATPase subunit a